jgi:Tol biopolymer transport system component
VHTLLGWYSFSYSPDGKKVAWIRSFAEGYCEIIIHDLEIGRENTITSDKKQINEIAWAREDQIFYTSAKSGVFNVWVVSSRGGTPVQITHETTPVNTVRCSTDGQKLLYFKEGIASDIYIFDGVKNHTHQITFGEEDQNFPRVSPDGKEIAVSIGGVNSLHSHLYVMDRDGSNRRQLTFGDEVVYELAWSPDGQHIAYGSRKISETSDALQTYIVEVSNPSSPKHIAQGFPQGWVDSTRIHIWRNWLLYLTFIDAASPKLVYDDSTYAFLIQGGRYILFNDLHQGKDRGVWIVNGRIPREIQRKTARLLPWNSQDIMVSGDGMTLYSLRGNENIWKMTLPDGKEERIKTNFHGVERLDDIGPSWDGKEIVFVKRRYSSKMVMIENLFK